MGTPAVTKGDPYAEFGGQSQETQRANDPYSEFGGQTIQQPPQPSAASRFWAGAKAGTGEDNALSERYKDPKNNRPIADNPLIPGTGVYRDIKAGNYAGAAGRVVGPAAMLGLSVLGGKSAEPDPAAGLATLPTPKAIPAGESGEALATLPVSKQAPAPPTSQRVPVGNFAKEVPNPDPYKFPGAPKSMDIVQSTNVGKIGYNPASKTMTVEYKNGFVYSYEGVPQEIYSAAKDAESAGSYISRNVKGRYETVRRGSVLVKKK